MAHYPADTFQEATEIAIEASNQLHGVINGDANAEVTVEDGSKVPSIRKALLDNFYFKDPIAWQVGQTENVFNQLRQFTDGSWWYAPSATASNPVSMGSSPVGDVLWKIYDFDAIGKLEPRIDEALRRSYAEAGYNLVDGSFELGGTLVNANDVLLQERTGKGFSGPAGTVAAGTVPSGPNYTNRGDGTLRSDLANPNKGAAMVARGVVAVDSIADLLSLPEGQRKEGLLYLVKGYHAGSDTGGGEFYWVLNSTEEADGGTVFSAGESGRFYRVARRSEEWNVHWFGANGSGGSQNALPYLRAAFAAMPVGKTLFFPGGNYFVQSSTDEVLLEIRKNFNIRGESKRGANIQATASLPTATVIGINITNNSGFLDVRGWDFSSIRVTAGTAKHAVAYIGGMSLLSSSIRDCWLVGNEAAGGDGLHFPGYGFAHSRIEGCHLSSIYAAFADLNVIRSNLFLGNRTAIVLELQSGVRCTKIEDNTIVNRDGALHIINGDNVRFINNQCEQNQSYGMNQNPVSAMVWIEGRNRYCRNTVIRDNNFGGGTNVNHGLYIDNARRTVIDANHWISVNTAEIRMTSATKHTLVMPNQSFHGSAVNPRRGTLFKGRIMDDGVGSMGVLQSRDKVTLYNGWEAGGFYKDASGVVRDIGGFSKGSPVEGSDIALLPATYSPVIPNDADRINGLIWTQDFSNGVWGKVYTEVDTDEGFAPDGTLTADLVRHVTNGGTTQKYIRQSGQTLQNNSQYTISLYAKRVSAGTVDLIRLELTDSSATRWVRATLNLSTGDIATTANSTYYPSSAITAGSESVGGGWWHFWVTFETLGNVASGGSYSVGVALANIASVYSSWEADPTVNRAYLWGAQLNEGELGDYQIVEDADTFSTLSKTVAVSAMTEDGPGYVRINRQGLVTVGSLPSNKGVIISPFQSSVTTEGG